MLMVTENMAYNTATIVLKAVKAEASVINASPIHARNIGKPMNKYCRFLNKNWKPLKMSPTIGMPEKGSLSHESATSVALKCDGYSVTLLGLDGCMYSVPGRFNSIIKPVDRFKQTTKIKI